MFTPLQVLLGYIPGTFALNQSKFKNGAIMRKLWKTTCSAAVTLAVAMTGMRGNGQTLEEITSNFPLTIADGARSYIYGSPLMLMGVTSRTGTNVPNATTKLAAAP